jgi:hypothetical protein
VPLTREASYHTAYLSAYAAGGTLIATATAPVIASISEPEHLQNFRPSTVAVSSSIPIQFVTLDFDDPFLDDGSRLLFDDLTLTVAEQVPLARPTLGIESLDPGRVVVSYDTPTARLQQTGNLDKGPWQSTPRPVQAGYVVIDPRTNSSMFFRALR